MNNPKGAGPDVPIAIESDANYIKRSELEPTIKVLKLAIGRLLNSTITGPMLQTELSRLESLLKK